MAPPADAARFSISRLTTADGEPKLAQMQPMLRRHAGRLGRLVCDVAYRVLDGATGVPMVLCSRYGEVARSVDLLTAMANGTELSPTSFGLSVHNAVGGLFTMARQDTANCIALAGGDESAEYGIIEACGLLSDGAERVLLVVGDCPLPDIYESFADVEPAAYAWGCYVEAAANDPISLVRSGASAPRGDTRRPPAALAALHFLRDGSRELLHDAGDRRWRWGRDAV